MNTTLPNPTIAAAGSGWTPARRSPRALIRLSGPEVPGLLARLLRPAPARPWTIARAALRLTDTLELPVLAARYDPPRSFTGEPMAELVIPGNPILIERVLARLSAEPGVREAGPGEFSARAFLNGKLTLSQAEGVAAVIAAAGEQDLSAAESLMSGRTGERYRAWVDELANLLALVEAGIDFTDQEDVVPIAPGELRRRAERLHTEIRAHLGRESGAEQPRHAPRVVLIGPPNAGKSTLFNALLGRKRAVESPLAGTTRDALVEELDLSADAHIPGAGGTVLLIDLPGLDQRPTAGPDLAAQAAAAEEIRRADIFLVCRPADASLASTPAAATSVLTDPATAERARPVIRVTTKADLPRTPSAGARTDEGEGAIGVCALDGWHIGVLRRAIADATWAERDAGAAFLLPRHRLALGAACERLEAVIRQVDPRAPSLDFPETLAGELRSALDALSELTGDISPDDIIGRVFATFCVGK